MCLKFLVKLRLFKKYKENWSLDLYTNGYIFCTNILIPKGVYHLNFMHCTFFALITSSRLHGFRYGMKVRYLRELISYQNVILNDFLSSSPKRKIASKSLSGLVIGYQIYHQHNNLLDTYETSTIAQTSIHASLETFTHTHPYTRP